MFVFKKGRMMKLLRRLQSYMGAKKYLIPVAIILSGLSAILALLPFICVWKIITQTLTDNIDIAIQTLAIMAFIAAFASVALYFAALSLSHIAAFRLEVSLRKTAMEKLIHLPLGLFELYPSGKIRKIIDSNASITHAFVAHQIPDLTGSILAPIISIILTFYFDWRLGIMSLIPIVWALFIMSQMMSGEGKVFMKNYLSSLENLNTEAVEYVRGIPVVKIFQQTVFSFKSFHHSIIDYKNMVIEYTKLWQNPMSKYVSLIQGITYFLVPVGVILINIGEDISAIITNLLFFILITPVFAQAIMRSAHLGQAIHQANEAIDRIDQITSFNDFTYSQNPKTIHPDNCEIAFKNVIFFYPQSTANTLSDINFKIPHGTTTALVGVSGGGKTTIARLIPRFWDANHGEITIGTTDIKEISKTSLMQNIAFVFQNTRLFKTSILENIKYGNEDATDEMVEKAIEYAQCKNIINKLPNGLDTQIGAQGIYLSGGEKQRIVLARAILKDAPIIILDEATAFADPENEHLIKKALDKLTQGKTVLMIAHRLNSIVAVDQILVMQQGEIKERGSHQQLRKENGIYEKMWNEYQNSIKWMLKEGVNNA